MTNLVSSKRKYEKRLNNYNALGSSLNPDVIGLINNDIDFDLGTPSLTRKENITLLASNSSKEVVLIKFKWRPLKEPEGFVHLTAKLTLDIDGVQYESCQSPLIYEPTKSNIRPGRIVQYGGAQSSLKFSIAAPYRRERVTFKGQMWNKSSNDQSDTKFVKCNFLVSPTGGIFDFLNEIDEKHAKEQYSKAKMDMSFDEAVDQLVAHDAHEQAVEIQGEYVIADIGPSPNKTKGTFFGWGFCMRQILDEKSQSISTKQIRAYLRNGQALHMCLAKNKKGNELDFGYTSFHMLPSLDCIQDKILIDWTSIDAATQEFEFEIKSQNQALKGKGKRRGAGSDFFEFSLDGRLGWAHISIDEAVESKDELETVELQREDFLKRLKEQQIERSVSFSKSEKPLVVNFEEDDCACAELVGAKAASLAKLHSLASASNSGYIVPQAVVLTRFAHDVSLVQNPTIKSRIDSLEQLVVDGKLSELKDACQSLQELISETALPEILLTSLIDSLKKQHKVESFPEELSFAVRSSSWGEDEEDMSAAGQLSTVLGVRGADALKKAVMVCFASKFTFANVEYKRQHGLPLSLPMAVVVQLMVGCEKAGVMFTCDPTTGDDSQLTITANFGLGESVVSGQAEPDCIKVRCGPNSQDLSIESVEIGAKKIVIGADGREDTTDGARDRSKCCLEESEILRLAKCGLLLVRYFQSPRDIEWGFKGDQLYLFQSRPVTSLDSYTDFELLHECDLTSGAETEFLSRANVGEVMPYASTPLSLSYGNFHWNVMGYRMANKFQPRAHSYTPQVASEVVYNSYHAFFRLRCGMLFAIREGNKTPMAQAMEIGLFGHELDPQPEIYEASRGIIVPPNYFQGTKFNLFSLPHKWMPFKTIEKEKVVMRRLRAQVRQLKFATGYSFEANANNMRPLYEQMKAVQDFSFNSWLNHITILLLSNNANLGAIAILCKYIKDPKRIFSCLNRILGATKDVLSAEIPHRINKMGEMIKARGQEEVDKFLSCSTEEALAYLEGKDGNKHKELVVEFETFLERFGHRCYNEFELSALSWAQDKKKLLEAIRKNCKSPPTASGKDPEPDKKKSQSLSEIVDSLELEKLSKKDELLLKYLIGPQCQTMLSGRERTKDILIDYTDILREVTRNLAREMRRQFRIPDEDLLYYFFMDELEPLIREPQPSLVIQATRRRNMANKLFKDTWRFDEIISGYHFLPNHMKPNPELDAATMSAPRLSGTPASSGKVQARVCLVMGYEQLDKVRAGDILVTHSTDIAFSPVFPLISGIVTEVGGLISHGAVVAREYGLPSLLGIPNVTRILEDGEEIILDADNGAIIRLSK